MINRQAARTCQCLLILVCAMFFALQPQRLHAQAIPAGTSQRTLDIAGTPIEIFTYKPAHYAGGPLLLSLHGLARNAQGYRNHAVALADRHGFLVVAPLFDRERFSTWRYQQGGMVRPSSRDGEGDLQLEPRAQWTGHQFLRIIETVRTLESAPRLPYYLLGHSAGGQTLSRFAAFIPHEARRIVIANPSTWLWPARDARFPFGFGGLPDELASDTVLQRYLAQPIIVLLGSADIEVTPDLNVSPPAMRQGANRYERGRNAYQAAQALAADRGWPFNWQLVEVPGVGHSAARMFRSSAALQALTPQP